MIRRAVLETFRNESTKEATRKYAEYPLRFMEIRQPDSEYILIPRHSSENRRYIPMGFLSSDQICGDATAVFPIYMMKFLCRLNLGKPTRKMIRLLCWHMVFQLFDILLYNLKKYDKIGYRQGGIENSGYNQGLMVANNDGNINVTLQEAVKMPSLIYEWYMEAKGDILLHNRDSNKTEIDIVRENSDIIIDMVKEMIRKSVIDSHELMFREDMELGIAGFTCFCFMECKILEKPL